MRADLARWQLLPEGQEDSVAVLRDSSIVDMVFKLMDRGLTGDQIHRAMKHMVGPDWREIKVSDWLERLRVQGYVLHDDRRLTTGDLEALVKGRIALEHMNRNDHTIE